MDALLIKPSHSLLVQSRHAEESTFAINADGFGVGWYSAGVQNPGVYKETRPAWNDDNLASLAGHVVSPLFMAHIRAATSTVSRTNCHPFSDGRWMFQHNGVIGDFATIRHDLTALMAPDVFARRTGCTDSETMFGLCLTAGLEDHPAEAIATMIRQVEEARAHRGISEPFRMTIAVTEGQHLWAARYGSDDDGPSLYHSASQAALQQATSTEERIESAATIVVSEPLDACDAHWVPIPPRSLLRAAGDVVEISPLPI